MKSELLQTFRTAVTCCWPAMPLAAMLFCINGCSSSSRSPVKPNIVFILADDLGWADLPVYGNAFNESPNLERLAGDGMTFTQAYAACQSSQELKLDRIALMLDSGESTRLEAFDAETGRQAKVLWETDEPSVARVEADGTVTAVATGQAMVSASHEATGAEASCRVSVDVRMQNPALPPSWELYIPDPEPKVYDGKIYVYGSLDVDNGILPTGVSWCSDRYHVIYSGDMLHWNDAGVSFQLDWIPEDYKTPETTRLWAPDVLRHPVSGKYYLYSCFNQKEGGNIMVSVSDRPEGPFLDPVPLLIDGREPIDRIDPGVLVDDDGRAYITWPFQMGQLDPDNYAHVMGHTVEDVSRWMPADNPPFEGPSLRKRGDTYYYIYIQNDGPKELPDGTRHWSPTRMAYMTAKNPLGPYEYRGLIISTSGYPNVVNVHGSLVEFEGDWYVFYHLPVIDKRLTRVMCIDRVTFRPDGSIVEVLPTSSGIRGAFRPGDRIQASSAVIYPGGKMTPASVSRSGDYPKLIFSNKGSSAGYRYVDLSGLDKGSVTLDVNTVAEGGMMELWINDPDGTILAAVPLPDTGGERQQVTGEFDAPAPGRHTLYVRLGRPPENGAVEFSWFSLAAH
jgi:arabinoxylan arabinofuranohydrolase